MFFYSAYSNTSAHLPGSAVLRWFLPRDPLLLAIDSRDLRRLVYIIRRRKFTILGYPQSDGLDPNTFTQQDLIAQIKRDADAVAGDGPIRPMTVDHNGRVAVVAFTKPKFVSAYIQQLVMKLNRVVGVPTYEISGGTLMGMLADDCDILLNPGSSVERVLGANIFIQ